MVDFNGSGGLAGYNPFAGASSGPAMSANQINSSMGMGPGGAGAQNQALLDNLYGPQGFGGQTAQYAAAGAAAGRNTGGFGGYGGMNDPFSPVGGYNALDDAASKAYFEKYPDVAKSGMTAQQHWQNFGQKEGREGFGMSAYPSASTNSPQSIYGYGLDNMGGYSAPSQGFGAAPDAASQAYFEKYPDVAKSGMTAQQHWQNFGQAEGREGFGMSAYPSAATNSPQSIYGYGLTGGGNFAGSGRDQLAQAMQGGSSNSPSYQGNPYYLPGPMPGSQGPTQGGGGFGAPGFGIGQPNYTGQPGFGLGIGQIGPGSVGPAYGTTPGGNPGFGFGGFTDSPNEQANWGYTGGNAGG